MILIIIIIIIIIIIEIIQYNPSNSNSEGKQKTVPVSGVSSYQGQLKYSIFEVNN